MLVIQAPMEGVIDCHMRRLLASIGGIDRCVTEFIRVTNSVLPERVFFRAVPELKTDCLTANQTPVAVQLLGNDPHFMALNAVKLSKLGASAIDLNFGCPARTVNNHGGGARLLQTPAMVATIVEAVRHSVPASIPVTAKMRLGFQDRNNALEIAERVEEAGADELVIHARSAKDRYQPPAYWEALAPIRKALRIPVIANGEMWNQRDVARCMAQSGCEHIMLGRGLLANPGFALAINQQANVQQELMIWERVVEKLLGFHLLVSDIYPEKYTGNRIKQWLVYLQRHYWQAEHLFSAIKPSRDKLFIARQIDRSRQLQTPQEPELGQML